MELKDLWNKQDWRQTDLAYDVDELNSEIQEDVQNHIKTLIRFYYRSLVLNILFLLLVFSIYLIIPKPDMLLPIAIIFSAFLFLIVKLARQLVKVKQPDANRPLKEVLVQTIDYDRELNKGMCQYNSILLTASFLGGLLLGFFIQGKTIQYLIDKPLVAAFLLMLTIGFYFLSKSKAFQSLNKLLAPKYFKTRKHLEEQLRQLQE